MKAETLLNYTTASWKATHKKTTQLNPSGFDINKTYQIRLKINLAIVLVSWFCVCNRPFPSCSKPLLQSEASMQLKVIFTGMVLLLASFRSESFWNSETAYWLQISRPFLKRSIFLEAALDPLWDLIGSFDYLNWSKQLLCHLPKISV